MYAALEDRDSPRLHDCFPQTILFVLASDWD